MKTAFKTPLLFYLILAGVGLVIDFSFNAYIQLIVLYVIINSLLAMSLNLVNGFTGQFSLGHAGFMAIGAYVSAIANTKFFLFSHLSSPLISFINFSLYTFLAGIVAALAGYLVGLPSLRLKGDYLAIVTLGFGEIIRVTLLNIDYVGGARGYSGIPSIGSFYFSFLFSSAWALVCFFTLWRLIRSSHGRGFLSVREDEIAAAAMGVNTTQQKVRAFVLSSFFAGVAGALFAHVTNYINPSTFTFLKSIDSVIMVVLGGMGSLTGSVIAAIIITALPEVLRPLQDLIGIDLRMVIYSLCLIIMMIVRPQGLFGSLELPQIWSKYVRRSS